MRHRINYQIAVQLVDHNQEVIASESLKKKLDGLVCFDDSVLNYLELPIKNDCELRGGNPRVILDEKLKMFISVEIDSLRKLKRTELSELKEDLNGQMTDGIGAGCFDELSQATGVSIEVCFPIKVKCTQQQGTAWRPKATAAKGNQKRIAAAEKVVEKLDATAPSQAKKSAPSKSADLKKPVKKTPTKKAMVSAKASRSKQTKATPTKAAAAKPTKQSNFKKLFRLLDKVERDQLFPEIKAELEKCGNDLSTVSDGQLPYMNFNSAKLLRLLLNAGLPIETTDIKGHSLLVLSAAGPESLKLLIKQGADVNRVCDVWDDSTALLRASRLGNLKSVQVLLDNGADPSLQNQSGETASQVVDKYSRNHDQIVQLLEA